LNVFDLFASIRLDDNSFTRGLNNAEQKGQNFATKAGNAIVGFGKVAAAGLAVAGTAFGKLTLDSLKLGGELEQNLGGLGAVFSPIGDEWSETAQKMENISKTAFKDMGLSASDFMATANKMGALFKGSGFGIEEAADISAQAMQRAADVASIMGIDVGAAMESVAGAAKGNFTMMDNLGVAMNATTIEAYALSKGIKKSYSEMDNQQKIGLAMEMFLDKTAYAAGNYAKENDTLAGSLNTAKAALSNWLSGAGDVDDVVSSVTKLSDVVVGNLSELLPRLTEGLVGITSGLINKIPEIFQALLPSVIEGALTLVDGVMSILPSLVDVGIGVLPQFVEAILSMLPQMIVAGVRIISALMSGIGKMAPELIPMVVLTITDMATALIGNIDVFVEAAMQLIQGLAQGILNAVPVLLEQIPYIIYAIVDALTISMPMIIDTGFALLTALIDALPAIIEVITAVLPVIINAVVGGLLDNLDSIIEAGVTLFIALIENLGQIIDIIVAAIPTIINAVIDAIMDNLDLIIDAGVTLFIALVENLPLIIATIVKAIPKIVDGISEAIIEMLPKMAELGNNLMEGLWRGISEAGTWLKGKIEGFFGGVVSTIKGVFDIHSPSRVTGDIGTNIITSFANNVLKAKSVVDSAIDKVFGGLGGDIAYDVGLNQSGNLPSMSNLSMASMGLAGTAAMAGAGSVVNQFNGNIIIPVEDLKELKDITELFEYFTQAYRAQTV